MMRHCWIECICIMCLLKDMQVHGLVCAHACGSFWRERESIVTLCGRVQWNTHKHKSRTEVLTLCRTMSKGPWSERGLCWSIATNNIPLFLHWKQSSTEWAAYERHEWDQHGCKFMLIDNASIWHHILIFSLTLKQRIKQASWITNKFPLACELF